MGSLFSKHKHRHQPPIYGTYPVTPSYNEKFDANTHHPLPPHSQPRHQAQQQRPSNKRFNPPKNARAKYQIKVTCTTCRAHGGVCPVADDYNAQHALAYSIRQPTNPDGVIELYEICADCCGWGKHIDGVKGVLNKYLPNRDLDRAGKGLICLEDLKTELEKTGGVRAGVKSGYT
ncbi:hypothetical protein VTI74DRAFT_11670 [Chaetomium olivicolor]